MSTMCFISGKSSLFASCIISRDNLYELDIFNIDDKEAY